MCTLGSPCDVQIAGRGLSTDNAIQVVDGADCSAAAAVRTGLVNPAQPPSSAGQYAFGTITGVGGALVMCSELPPTAPAERYRPEKCTR